MIPPSPRILNASTAPKPSEADRDSRSCEETVSLGRFLCLSDVTHRLPRRRQPLPNPLVSEEASDDEDTTLGAIPSNPPVPAHAPPRRRATLLSPRLLDELRTYWRLYRPKDRLFPSAFFHQRPVSIGALKLAFNDSPEPLGQRRAGLLRRRLGRQLLHPNPESPYPSRPTHPDSREKQADQNGEDGHDDQQFHEAKSLRTTRVVVPFFLGQFLGPHTRGVANGVRGACA